MKDKICMCAICSRKEKSDWPPAKEMASFELRESLKNAMRYLNNDEIEEILKEIYKIHEIQNNK